MKIWPLFIVAFLAAAVYGEDINEQLKQLDANTAGIEQVIKIFGEPKKYVWGQPSDKNGTPDTYIAEYLNGFSLLFINKRIVEIRHEGNDGYIYEGKVTYGSSLREIIQAFGKPNHVVNGENEHIEGILYKDTEKQKSYYAPAGTNLRIVLQNDRVIGLYNIIVPKSLPAGESEQQSLTENTTSVKTELEKKSNILSPKSKDLNELIAQLDVDNAGIEEIRAVFGEPLKYAFDNQTFNKNNLPECYIAVYPKGFRIVMVNDRIDELRHEDRDGYIYQTKKGEITFGSTIKEVIKATRKPQSTEVGKKDSFFKKGVLYKDRNGEQGICYYAPLKHNLRIFFVNNKVSALYVTTDYSEQENNNEPAEKPQRKTRTRSSNN